MPRQSLVLLASLALTACGGAPQEPAQAAPPTASPSASAPAASAAPPSGDKTAQCFATANAKRARGSGEPAKVTVKHVLVKYKGAKNAAPEVTRTRAAACLRALEALEKMRGGADWDEVVKTYSDEAGAATRGGSIGAVERKDVASPFGDAAFELSLNQMSDVVETEFGFHLILRTQ